MIIQHNYLQKNKSVMNAAQTHGIRHTRQQGMITVKLRVSVSLGQIQEVTDNDDSDSHDAMSDLEDLTKKRQLPTNGN